MIKKLLICVIIFVFCLAVSVPMVQAQSFNLGFSAIPGTQSGTVQLNWVDNSLFNNYNIAYGPSAGNYVYGVTNIGNLSSYTIGGLIPGQTYYFVISPIMGNGNQALGYTPAVSAKAAGNGVTANTPGASGQAKVTAISGGPSGAPWNLTAVSGAIQGQVTLTWFNNQGADSFDLVYGTTTGLNQYGYQNIVQAGQNYRFVVGGLVSGQRYYFSILPEKGGKASGPFANPVSAVAQ